MENELQENVTENANAVEELTLNSAKESEDQKMVARNSAEVVPYNSSETLLERKIMALVARTSLLIRMLFVAACISLLCGIICFSRTDKTQNRG